MYELRFLDAALDDLKPYLPISQEMAGGVASMIVLSDRSDNYFPTGFLFIDLDILPEAKSIRR